MAMASRVAAGAPLSNRFHKAALQKLRGALPIAPDELAANNDFAYTEDFREAVQAFIEKRKPVWRAR
jgi:enoyl-CoA hydratase/carnithine racemase